MRTNAGGRRRGGGRSRRSDCRGPVVTAPLLGLDVAASRGREEQRSIETRGRGFECVYDPPAQRDTPSLARRLRTLLQAALRVDAANVDDALPPVDIAPLKRGPLLGAQAGAGGEERDGGEAWVELGGDGLDLGPGLERDDLGPSRLRVLDDPGGVLVQPVPADRLFEHLT